MSRSSDAFQDSQERDNDSGMDMCEAYHAEQESMPEHQRDWYTERICGYADDARKAARERIIF